MCRLHYLPELTRGLFVNEKTDGDYKKQEYSFVIVVVVGFVLYEDEKKKNNSVVCLSSYSLWRTTRVEHTEFVAGCYLQTFFHVTFMSTAYINNRDIIFCTNVTLIQCNPSNSFAPT